MDEFFERLSHFKGDVFPQRQALFEELARNGQSPKALMISCADSRVIPEQIMQAEPGELFVTRNAGNIVPPFSEINGGVSSAVEYAVVGLGVRDIIVCGHSDCGAMKAFSNPDALAKMPNVAAWLRHAHAAHGVVCDAYPHDMDDHAHTRALSLENVVVQINHLRTHPSVASAITRGDLSLHGWFFDIETGEILALDGETGAFQPVREGQELPRAVAPSGRRAYDPQPAAIAAE